MGTIAQLLSSEGQTMRSQVEELTGELCRPRVHGDPETDELVELPA
jgi:hypothetical protein